MNAKIRNILFPTDFSSTAREAQQYAMELVEKFGATLHLLHVVPEVIMPLPDSSTSWTIPEANINQHIEDANKQLLREVGETWAGSHQVQRTTTFGFVVDEIVKYAKEHEIDLIVLGTHGRTGLSHLLLGSVAEKTVRMATCPVLTVHPRGHKFPADSATGPSSVAKS